MPFLHFCGSFLTNASLRPRKMALYRNVPHEAIFVNYFSEFLESFEATTQYNLLVLGHKVIVLHLTKHTF